MSDLLYVVLTLACFAGLALLTGAIDRYLTDDPDPDGLDADDAPATAGATAGEDRPLEVTR